MKSYEQWRQEKESPPLPYAPAPEHLVEVQHGDIELLKRRTEIGVKPYQVMRDDRLVVVLATKHKWRLGLVLHTFAHKGCPSVLKVRFIDKAEHIPECVVDRCEVRGLKSEVS